MKTEECPFIAINNRCTHKDWSSGEKKNYCRFEDTENCPMYNSWLKLEKPHHNPSKRELEAFIRSSEELNPRRAKKCSGCNKIIRYYNKSGMCGFCQKKRYNKRYQTPYQIKYREKQKTKHLNTN